MFPYTDSFVKHFVISIMHNFSFCFNFFSGAGGSCKAMIISFFVIGIIMAVILGYAAGKECFDDRCPKSYGEQFRYGVMKILYPKSYTESVP